MKKTPSPPKVTKPPRKTSSPSDEKLFHVTSELPGGDVVLARCPDNGEPELIVMRQLKQGRPMAADAPVTRIVPHEDGRHVRVEEVRFTTSGPVQVATDAYRSGWDTAFGTRRDCLN